MTFVRNSKCFHISTFNLLAYHCTPVLYVIYIQNVSSIVSHSGLVHSHPYGGSIPDNGKRVRHMPDSHNPVISF